LQVAGLVVLEGNCECFGNGCHNGKGIGDKVLVSAHK
jgi:hypothetical protein